MNVYRAWWMDKRNDSQPNGPMLGTMTPAIFSEPAGASAGSGPQ